MIKDRSAHSRYQSKILMVPAVFCIAYKKWSMILKQHRGSSDGSGDRCSSADRTACTVAEEAEEGSERSRGRKRIED